LCGQTCSGESNHSQSEPSEAPPSRLPLSCFQPTDCFRQTAAPSAVKSAVGIIYSILFSLEPLIAVIFVPMLVLVAYPACHHNRAGLHIIDNLAHSIVPAGLEE
jgi:hypothetical protein